MTSARAPSETASRVVRAAAVLIAMAVSVGCDDGRNGLAVQAQQPVPSRIGLLLDEIEGHNVDDHLVFLNHIRVQPTKGGVAWYAIGPTGAKVLVVPSKSFPIGEHNERRFDVFGAIRTVPSAGFARRVLRLEKEDVAAVLKQRSYIDRAVVTESISRPKP